MSSADTEAFPAPAVSELIPGIRAVADRPPLPIGTAVASLASCALATAALLARRRTHLPLDLVGRRLRFADGTASWVYRETTVDRQPEAEPCLLVVGFRLRLVRGVGHPLFRWESILNTPLFVGFPGLMSKLWLAADQRGTYRGIYEWDGTDRADHYVRCLWWVLALVCQTSTIRYVIVPGGDRTQLLDGAVPETTADEDGWWRVVADGQGASGAGWSRPSALAGRRCRDRGGGLTAP